MNRRILVTAALPYANGPIHIGHIVEYVQADIFVRFLRQMGKDVVYVCADDTHGAPIEINASKQGIMPEELIKRYYAEHTRDFAGFLVSFDSYYNTNSPENKKYSDLIFGRLKEKGLIYTKEIELTYCEKDKRFLPDRYVKGNCPKCGAPDQYGDVCEKCNSTYNTTDLVEPYCTVCKSRPVRKLSTHYFFKLSSLSDELKSWIVKNHKLQPEIKNFVLNWIEGGLTDWCISRDGPYFGFKIPGEENKYYYVWLDAPIGYIASTENYCRQAGKQVLDYWTGDSEIIHFIGKDIIYFHFLFWPAMLMASGFNLPDQLVVHGFLNVNKEKMSKSRGTFITAKSYLDVLNPEYLRFYYASNLTHTMTDIDLEYTDFKDKINNDLLGNLANYVYRVLSFTNNNFDSKLSTLSENTDLNIAVKERIKKIEQAYESFNYREAVKLLLEISALGNKYFQEEQPWKLIKTDKDRCQQIVTLAANIARDVAIISQPILPKYSESVLKQLNLQDQSWKNLHTELKDHTIGKAEIMFAKIEKVEFPQENAANPFAALNLKVAQVTAVEEHPNAEKLYKLQLDLGTEKRQLVAGLRPYYPKEELLGKHIVIITNLKPAMLRGVESQGMLLAADDGTNVRVLQAPNSVPGTQVTIEGAAPGAAQITIEDFQKVTITTKDGQAVSEGKLLKAADEIIIVDGIKDNAKVR